MLVYFEPPYPDETLESRCARTAKYLAYPSSNGICAELFGNRHYVVAPDLPYGLASLVDQLPPFHRETIESFCQQSTLLPFYAPFLSPDRLAWLQNEMASNNGSRIHSGSGLMASQIAYPTHMRYCPDCISVDRELWGEAYWHRAHQTAVSFVCSIHDKPLIESHLPYHHRPGRHEVFALETILADAPAPPPIPQWVEKYQVVLYDLAQDVAWLLSQVVGTHCPTYWYARYQALLREQGYATYTDHLRIQALVPAFLDYYPTPLLNALGCNLNSTSQHNWLLQLLRRPERFHHPLLHLLLIRFLGHSTASLAAYEPSTEYFEPGPWPCLNPVCKEHRVKVITTYQQSVTNDLQPAATFCCPICHLAYRRVGPDKTASAMFTLTDYVSFGPVWEAELARFWMDESWSLRGLASHLGVTTRTINRHAERLALTWPRPNHRQGKKPKLLTGTQTAIISLTLHQEKRDTWMALRQQHPDKGMTQLRQADPGLASWLWRNDKSWLKEHQPETIEHETATMRVDWLQRDIALSIRCIEAALFLLDQPQRPQRLSRTMILRHVGGQGIFEHHPNKLPILGSVVARLSECRVLAAIRRIWWVAQQQENAMLESDLIRQAGVERLKTEPAVHWALTTAGEWLAQSKLIHLSIGSAQPQKLHFLKQMTAYRGTPC